MLAFLVYRRYWKVILMRQNLSIIIYHIVDIYVVFSVVSNSIREVDNDMSCLIIHCLNCISHDQVN